MGKVMETANRIQKQNQVLALRKEGKSFRQIGLILGISSNRAWQIYKQTRNTNRMEIVK